VNKFGDQLFVKLTDEPVFVLRQFKHLTWVRRPVMGQAGIGYRFGLFFNRELETLQEQTQRTLAVIKARNDMAQEELADVEGPLAIPGLQFKKMEN
jgi:hypothetical protein